MKIAIDAHALGQRLTGNEVYVRNLLQGLANIDKRSKYLAYVSVQGVERFLPHGISVTHVSNNPFLRLGFDLPRRLRADKPDLVHLQFTGPLLCNVPQIVSVHDVSFLEHPEYFPRERCAQLRITVSRTVRQAARVLTGSEFARQSILRAYKVDPDKVITVPIAANPIFRRLPRERSQREVRDRLGIEGPFILTVGDLQPRKNHLGLIQAFRALAQTYPQIRHKLVMAGKHTWFAQQIYDTAKHSGLSDRIIFTGFVEDDDLLRLYNACDCFVFPSFYEGFGIPILEAMACGRAVACSNTSSMPEVADGAGILFDPQSKTEIARALADILLDPALRARLERLGLQRAPLFTWNRTAERTLEVYQEVVGATSSETFSLASLRPTVRQ
jgi:glycosyltransferase involved in cell wall biosynthesis